MGDKPLSEMTDQELQDLQKKLNPPLSMAPASPAGRLFAGFASSPEGKSKILENLGITGSLRDVPGIFDSSKEFFSDVGDVVSDAPELIGGAGGAFLGTVTGVGPSLGAGVGAGLGASVRQGIGNLLGSEEGFDVRDVARGTALGATGERILGSLFSKLPSPLRTKSKTANVQQNVVQPSRVLGIEDKVPAGALTESETVGKAQLRSFGEAGPSGDAVRAGPRQAFRDAQQGVLEDAAQGVGVTSRTPVGASDDLLSASAETFEQRMAAVGVKFDQAREAIPDPSHLPVVVDEARQALRRMSKRQNVSILSPDAHITAGSRDQLAKFSEDLAGIRNFDQLDAFRKEVGDLLKPGPRFEALRETGADRELLDLYGALARDLDESIAQGGLARELGGQTTGQIRGVNPGGRNASQMEAGILSEGELPTPPGIRKNLVARGRRGQPQNPRTSTEILDDLSGRVDEAQSLRVEAADSFKDIIALEDATIIRILKDPDQADSIFTRLFRRSSPAANIRRIKEKIGASPTQGGAAASAEGEAAWKNIQARIFRTVREDAEDRTQDILPGQQLPFNGGDMFKSLERLGGREPLNEAIGAEATDTLYRLADFVKNSDVSQRPFTNIPKSQARAVPLTFFEIALVRRAAQDMFDFALHRTGFPGKGPTSQFLTEGFATSPRAQGLLRGLGTAVSPNAE